MTTGGLERFGISFEIEACNNKTPIFQKVTTNKEKEVSGGQVKTCPAVNVFGKQ
jgi:hypothetical protein